MTQLLLFKLLAVAIIVASGLVGGLIPLRIELTARGTRLLSLGNAAAGGIFLGAGLIHLLGDATAGFAGGSDYPFAFLLCGCGFLGILGIERVLVRGDESSVMTGPGDRSVYPFVLLLVLSIHSIIVGISLGLEQTLAASLVVFGAIIAHKGSAAFALGVSLRGAGVSARRFTLVVAVFAVMTPLGIVLGAMGASAITGDTATFVEAVFDALAAGTFLYVATLDIIAEVYEEAGDRWQKLVLLASAFSLMALLAVWT